MGPLKVEEERLDSLKVERGRENIGSSLGREEEERSNPFNNIAKKSLSISSSIQQKHNNDNNNNNDNYTHTRTS